MRALRYAGVGIMLFAAPLVAYFIPMLFKHPYPDSFHFSHKAFFADWFTLVHFTSNAVLSWRIDSILDPVLVLFGERVFFAFETFIFVLGSFFLGLAFNENRRPLLSAFSVALSGAALAVFFGYDVLVFGAIVWFPWVFYLLYLIIVRNQGSAVFFIFLAFFVVRLAKSANQLSLLLAVLAFSAVYFLAINRKRHLTWGLSPL